MKVFGANVDGEIYTTNNDILDNKLSNQIDNIIDNDAISFVEFMPDLHAGKFYPNGFHAILEPNDDGDIYLSPSYIGNDAGCGVSWCKFYPGKKGIEFQKLDKVIAENIPTGFNNYSSLNKNRKDELRDFYLDEWLNYQNLSAYIDYDKACDGFGSLGSGNHFIEVGKSDDQYYLFVHTGSRNLGQQILTYWLDYAKNNTPYYDSKVHVYEMSEIKGSLKTGSPLSSYIFDVFYASCFAEWSREYIIKTICKNMKWKIVDNSLHSKVHNFVAKEGDKRVHICKGCYFTDDDINAPITVNQLDGILLVKGDRSKAIPHGSGRKIERVKISSLHTSKEVNDLMKERNIYTTTMTKKTIDEIPFAYRNMDYIIECLDKYYPNIEILHHIVPLYNFKPGSK